MTTRPTQQTPPPMWTDDACAAVVHSGWNVPADKIDLAAALGYRADAQALPDPQRLYFYENADPAGIPDFLRNFANAPVGELVAHWRILSADYSRWGVIALHSPGPTGDVELLAIATPGIWNAGIVRTFARLIFQVWRFRRVTLRIPDNRDDLKRYAMRLGFKHEGKQRGWFHDGTAASLWGMLDSECRWLKERG